MFVEHKQVGEVIEVPPKITKLSQAIREGAKLRPSCREAFFLDGRSCAMGAAIEALGFGPETIVAGVNMVVSCLPGADELWCQIVWHNDKGWSRESIADWVESQGY